MVILLINVHNVRTRVFIFENCFRFRPSEALFGPSLSLCARVRHTLRAPAVIAAPISYIIYDFILYCITSDTDVLTVLRVVTSIDLCTPSSLIYPTTNVSVSRSERRYNSKRFVSVKTYDFYFPVSYNT